MFAIPDFTDQIIEMLNKEKQYNESFEEIKELIFTSEMFKKNYTLSEKADIKVKFIYRKKIALDKALKNKRLTFDEAILIERLIAKNEGYEMIPWEEHCKLAEEKCEDITVPNFLQNIIDISLERTVYNEK